MAYVRLTSLAVLFFLAASVMLNVKKTEGGEFLKCGESCVQGECYTPGCSCDWPICKKNHIIATNAKTVNQHRLLCESHEDCFKKGTGNYCAFFPDSDVHFGWCFYAESDGYLLKDFFKMSKDNLKMPMTIIN
uniref:Cliotide T2 n=2 Tax=Clitoria ternatea TaxID=43366 RepID=CYC2_CLITE|nr:RecName: Full=Cliotide T2; Flags: Precursor [Clitoria ternatea]AEK26403.1 cyclotide precursor cliotide T2 [Clitoria ternatea]